MITSRERLAHVIDDGQRSSRGMAGSRSMKLIKPPHQKLPALDRSEASAASSKILNQNDKINQDG